MLDIDDWLWATVTAPSDRGMSQLRPHVRRKLFTDAAKALRDLNQTIVVGTGFPINGPPETDGPPGAFAICDALTALGKRVRIASWQDAIDIFAQVRPDLNYVRISRNSEPEPDPIFDGSHFVAVEVCGLTEDGTYRNMHHDDISHLAPNFEAHAGNSALIAIGDGGNEYGMGSLPQSFFEEWDVIPPVSNALHLLPSMVSNFGAYALVKALEVVSGQAGLLPEPSVHLREIEALIAAGCVNGMSGTREMKVDGHDLVLTKTVLKTLASRADFQQA